MAGDGGEVEAEALRLLRAAREDNTPAARQLRALVRLQVAAVLILTLVAAISIAATWYARTYIALGTMLAAIVSSALSLMFVALLPLAVWALLSGWQRKAVLVTFALRSIAASGDERMPAVIDQPAPLDTEHLAGELRVGQLHWLDKPRAVRRQLAFTLLLLLTADVAVPLTAAPKWRWAGPLAVVRPAFDLLPAPYGSGYLVWNAVYVCGAALCTILLFSWLFSGYRDVMASDEGLRWTTGWPRKRTMRIAWDEVRSFTRLEFRHKWSPKPHTTYVLDCGRAILSWGYDPIWRNDEFPVETRLLARLIVTRTGLPLRQATPFAAEVLYRAAGLPARWWARRLQMPRGAMMPPALPGLAAAFQLITPTSSRRRALVLVASLPLILYAGYAGASIFLR